MSHPSRRLARAIIDVQPTSFGRKVAGSLLVSRTWVALRAASHVLVNQDWIPRKTAQSASRMAQTARTLAGIKVAPGRELVPPPAFAKLGSKRGEVALWADPTPSTVIDRDLTVLSRSTGPMNPIE